MVERDFVIRQISVFLDNRPGSLAALTRYLADRQINLRAFSLAESRDFGAARLIVADTDACADALHEGGYHFSEVDVLAIEVPDRPGGMAHVLEIIAGEHINVEYAYAMIEKRECSAVVVLRVEDPTRSCAVLRSQDVPLLSVEDIASL
jgi:hypothetical protein